MFAAHKSSPLDAIGNVGQREWNGTGNYTWTCPPNVFSVCAVCVAPGTSGAGGLSWKNNIPVTPGNSYNVVITSTSAYFISTATVSAYYYPDRALSVREGGGDGGNKPSADAGGGGAGGYSGNGGSGSSFGAGGSGAGGGGGAGGYYNDGGSSIPGYGGGVGLLGQGSNGVGGSYILAPGNFTAVQGGGGSGGKIGYPSGDYGGGGFGKGAVRLMWGPGRAFPSTLCDDIGIVGRSWSQKGSSSTWTGGMCCSADGRIIYAARQTGFIARSMDYGETWVDIATGLGSLTWNDIACSPDGSKVVAARAITTQLYVSSDYGDNFSLAGSSQLFNRVYWSRNSNRVHALASSSLIYSGNGGGTWNTGVEPNATRTAITCSDDGSVHYIGYASNRIYKSIDLANWTLLTNSPVTTWNDLACNKDGNVVYGVGSSILPRRSMDGGATWNEIGTGFLPAGGNRVFCSSSGREVVIISNGSAVYCSSDHGEGWTKHLDETNFYSGTISFDGEKLYAGKLNGFIYKSAPRLG